jgi:regulatory protein
MNEKRLLNYAVWLLARKRYHSAELRRKLEKKSDTATVNHVLKRLLGYKYLDDNEYLILYIRDQISKKPQGPRLIKQKLLKKGIAAEEINEYLYQIPIDQYELAKKAIVGRKYKIANPKDKARLLRFLISRGFDYEVAIKSIKIK